jgi:hypothetical protein
VVSSNPNRTRVRAVAGCSSHGGMYIVLEIWRNSLDGCVLGEATTESLDRMDRMDRIYSVKNDGSKVDRKLIKNNYAEMLRK